MLSLRILRVRSSAAVVAVVGLIALAGAARADLDSGEWPQVLKVKQGKIVIYQPQPESLQGTILKSRAAVSITPKGKDEPVFGAVWLDAKVDIRKDDREVKIEGISVTKARLADAKPEQEEAFIRILQEEIGDSRFTIDYDRLLASLQDAEVSKSTAEGLRNAPPKVLFEFEPAILVVVDGQPILRNIPGTELQRVVNTPSYVVKHQDAFWLNGGKDWFTSKSITGEWKRDGAPRSVEKAFEDEMAATGAQRPEEPKDKRVPKIIAATTPTELIVIDGETQFAPLVGTELLCVTNTDSDVFMDVPSQKYYLVLSGRWYRSSMTDGPWQYVRSDSLPSYFAQIPPGSDKADVLPYVAGTAQAEDAVLDAHVPQTAAIVRAQATLDVTYDGEPKFESIPGTSIALAQNTNKTVLKIRDGYYCCDNAIWFVSNSPMGPWVVCDQVPEEVQNIPPESAAYNTKYVYVYESTPEVVYVGYTPAYIGCYPYYGSVVYGTGWYYPPYVSPHYYYPRPCTWGFHMSYNSYSGWSFGMSWSTGWGSVSVGFGGYGGYPGYGGGWWGPPGYRPIPPGGRPGYGGGGGRVDHHGRDNMYNRPSTQPAVADRATRDRNSPGASRERPTASTRDAQPARGTANNVYTDKNGNVMRRENDGSWSQRQNGNWQPQSKDAATRPSTQPGAGANRPSTQPATGQTRPSQGNTQQLNRDYQNRQRGNYNSNQYRSQSRPSSRPAGRSGGGGRRR